jgi:hypothetical protein
MATSGGSGEVVKDILSQEKEVGKNNDAQIRKIEQSGLLNGLKDLRRTGTLF